MGGIKASTTLTATAPTKASPNTAFAISGDLTTTTRHHALGNQRVDLWYAYNDNTGYHWFKTVYTDATGHWSTTDKDTQSIHYKAAYDGATWYDASTAYTGWVGIA